MFSVSSVDEDPDIAPQASQSCPLTHSSLHQTALNRVMIRGRNNRADEGTCPGFDESTSHRHGALRGTILADVAMRDSQDALSGARRSFSLFLVCAFFVKEGMPCTLRVIRFHILSCNQCEMTEKCSNI